MKVAFVLLALVVLGAFVTAFWRWWNAPLATCDCERCMAYSRQTRVVRLTLDACKVWPTSHVIVSESGARVVGDDGSVLAYTDGPYALDELEVLVWKRLEDA